MNKKTKIKISEFLSSVDWFFNLAHTDRSICYKENDENGLLADVLWEENYQRMTLNIYPRFFKQSAKEQVETLIHELTHILIDPLTDEAMKAVNGKFINKDSVYFQNERVTSSITERFVSLINGANYIKKAYKKYLK